jgi:hypothetical protein
MPGARTTIPASPAIPQGVGQVEAQQRAERRRPDRSQDVSEVRAADERLSGETAFTAAA